MIEVLSKTIGAIKLSGVSLLLMTGFGASHKLSLKKEKQYQDDVPGDNFPFVVMNKGYLE